MKETKSDNAWSTHTSSIHTMRTWARVLTSLEEVPEAFRSAFHLRQAAFPYTILIPEDKLSYLQKRNERLVCLYNDEVVVLEARREHIILTPFAFKDIRFIEQGRVLLHSWFTIQGRTTALSVGFETTTLPHFEPILQTIRQAASMPQAGSGRGLGGEADVGVFDSLRERNFKFMNYGRQSIRAGDVVRRIVFEPDHLLRKDKIFGRIMFRRYQTAHLAILTGEELILIRESNRTKDDDKNQYGGIFTYIPLRQIHELSFHLDRASSRSTLQIGLSERIHLRTVFAADNPDLAAFQAECEKIPLNAEKAPTP